MCTMRRSVLTTYWGPGNGLGYGNVNNDFIDFMRSHEKKITLGNAGSFWKTMATLGSLLRVEDGTSNEVAFISRWMDSQ